MDIPPNGDTRDKPALMPFVTATVAEITYAEELRRQIEHRYLNPSNRPGTNANIRQTRTRVVERA
jgi:hypothetical protein